MTKNTKNGSRRSVLITGAAGGLGRGLVEAFGAQGWRVAAAGHRSTPYQATDRLWPVVLDVTQPDQAAGVVRGIVERWGALDVLVNNAGCAADRLFWQLGQEDWEEVVGVNLKGAFLCARAVLPSMLRQRNGHIINIGSFSGRCGQRGQANYAAAKAGLFGWSAALAKEVGGHNVRVNVILPGVLPTPMTAALNQETLSQMAAANTLGRLNSVSEVAQFTVFLAAMNHVSGQIFQLDSRIAAWA